MASRDKASNDQRQRMIAEAAYYRAERRGFQGGDPVRDWCEAEAEVDARLRETFHAQCAARIEEALETANRKLTSVRRKAATLSAEARRDWQKDVDKLAALRGALKPRLAEIKEHGEQAGQKLREQAERIRDEIVELVHLLEMRSKR